MSDDVPQSKPLPGQVPNSAGGFTWVVDDMKRLQRFLVLGSEGGSYYIGEQQLTRENAGTILRLLADGKGTEVVAQVVEFSLEGRAAKQNPIIFALALCARDKDPEAKKAAYGALSKVCRIPTHLFTFIEYCELLSVGTGWGRAHRRAVCEWYNTKSAKQLAMAVTKYRNRNGWSHLDLLRLAHITPDNPGVALVCRYIVKGLDEARALFVSKESPQDYQETMSFLETVEAAKKADENMLVKYIRENGLVREHIPTIHLNSVNVRHNSYYLLT